MYITPIVCQNYRILQCAAYTHTHLQPLAFGGCRGIRSGGFTTQRPNVQWSRAHAPKMSLAVSKRARTILACTRVPDHESATHTRARAQQPRGLLHALARQLNRRAPLRRRRRPPPPPLRRVCVLALGRASRSVVVCARSRTRPPKDPFRFQSCVAESDERATLYGNRPEGHYGAEGHTPSRFRDTLSPSIKVHGRSARPTDRCTRVCLCVCTLQLCERVPGGDGFEA